MPSVPSLPHVPTPNHTLYVSRRGNLRKYPTKRMSRSIGSAANLMRSSSHTVGMHGRARYHSYPTLYHNDPYCDCYSIALAGLESELVRARGVLSGSHGNERAGQRLAPNGLGGVGETSARDTPSQDRDKSPKPELNHVQSTTWETSSYGDPDLRG